MKVLHFINSLAAGGAELHLPALCREQRRRGLEVVVAYLKDRAGDSRPLRADFEQAGVRIVKLPAAGRYDPFFPFRLARLLRVERPDVLHSHLPRADLGAAVARAFTRRVPWVCSVHDIHSASWSARWSLPAYSVVWRRPDALVAISQAVKRWLVEERGIPAGSVAVIHYGIEARDFLTPSDDLRSQWGLAAGTVVGSIGRLEPRKGHDCLLEAVPAVRARVPGVVLLVAGHDPWGYGERLRARLALLELDGHARLVGFQGDVASFLHALDVFAFASRAEGFGQVLLEAMAAGKPVVASQVAPLTEIVVHGETGLLVAPDDPAAFAEAIAWLLTHPDQASRMGERGRERVQRCFSVTRMADRVAALYGQLCNGRPRSAGSDPGAGPVARRSGAACESNRPVSDD